MNTVQMPDRYLVEKAQGGDSSAMDALILRHRTRAHRFASRLTKNPDEAADAVGKAFLRICRSIGTFKGQCAFTTWLYRIITNCYLDMRKREEAHAAVSFESYFESDEGDSLFLQVADSSPDGFDEALRGEKNIAVEMALKELPGYQKTIIEMFHLDLLTYEEIAQILDIPVGTVKSRLSRARCNLSAAIVNDRSLFDEHNVCRANLAVA